jgi:hypothetical protein
MTMPNDRNAGAPTGTVGTETGDQPGGGGTGGARAQIREVKDQVVDQAKNSFRQARNSATSSLSQSRGEAAVRISQIAHALRGTSEFLRADHLDEVANLTDSLAEQVDRLSSYLRDRELAELRNDIEGLVRRQPAVAAGLALALGVMGARFLKSSQRAAGSDGGRSFQDGGSGDSYDMGAEQRGGYGTGTSPAGGYGMSSQSAGGGYGGA